MQENPYQFIHIVAILYQSIQITTQHNYSPIKLKTKITLFCVGSTTASHAGAVSVTSPDITDCKQDAKNT